MQSMVLNITHIMQNYAKKSIKTKAGAAGFEPAVFRFWRPVVCQLTDAPLFFNFFVQCVLPAIFAKFFQNNTRILKGRSQTRSF